MIVLVVIMAMSIVGRLAVIMVAAFRAAVMPGKMFVIVLRCKSCLAWGLARSFARQFTRGGQNLFMQAMACMLRKKGVNCAARRTTPAERRSYLRSKAQSIPQPQLRCPDP
ncbi:MAG: hypothetical protein RR687_08965 [Comamonas sp.]